MFSYRIPGKSHDLELVVDGISNAPMPSKSSGNFAAAINLTSRFAIHTCTHDII